MLLKCKESITDELTGEEIYPVLGCAIADGKLDMLLINDAGNTDFYPVTLFDILDFFIPSSWSCWQLSDNEKSQVLPSRDNVSIEIDILIGYDQLTSNLEHVAGLILHNNEDMFIAKKQLERINHQYTCRVCGFDQDFLPWGEDGKSKTHMLCGCCGVEFGYQDQDYDAVQQFREKWLESGQVWFDDSVKPTGWTIGKDLGKQLMNIPREYK